jgi:CRP-like cAMP-binding protein
MSAGTKQPNRDAEDARRFVDLLTDGLRADECVAGETVVAAGSLVEGALAIRKGPVRLLVTSGDRSAEAGSINAPALIGVGWALRRRSAPFDVVAADAVTTVLVPTERLLGAVRSSPVTALCCALAIDDTAALYERALSLAASPLRVRIAEVLLREARQDGPGSQVVTLTHREIADQLGSSRQSVSRELKSLERDGLTECRYGTIVLLDVDALGSMWPS